MNLANAKDYFNSIKVQLKLSHSLLPQMQLKQFQFHKGTIKTDYALGVYRAGMDFNSIKVQLKLETRIL